MSFGITKGQASASSGGLIGVMILVIIAVTAVIPVVKDAIANTANLTATEETILDLVTLFIILGIVFVVLRTSGLI